MSVLATTGPEYSPTNVGFHLSSAAAVGMGYVFTVLFVGSLYVWRNAITQHRDHPTVVKQRIISVSVVSVASGIILAFFAPVDTSDVPINAAPPASTAPPPANTAPPGNTALALIYASSRTFHMRTRSSHKLPYGHSLCSLALILPCILMLLTRQQVWGRVQWVASVTGVHASLSAVASGAGALLLTVILFLGPLVADEAWTKDWWIESFEGDLMWLRNVVVVRRCAARRDVVRCSRAIQLSGKIFDARPLPARSVR